MAGKEVSAKGKDKCKKPESPSACNDPGAGHPGRKDGRCLPEGADSVALSMKGEGGEKGRPVPSWWRMMKAVRDSKEQLSWFFNFSEPQFPRLQRNSMGGS